VPTTDASSAPATVTTDDPDLAADRSAAGSSAVLPVVAGALVLALLGSVGALAWRRRKV
jgi:LPXTG-motif cell wall-anchored protein